MCTALTARFLSCFFIHSFYFLPLTFYAAKVDLSSEKILLTHPTTPLPQGHKPQGGGGGPSLSGGCHVHRTLPAETGRRLVCAPRVAAPPVSWRELPVLVLGHRPAGLGSVAAQLGLPSSPDLTQERPGRQVGGSHTATQPGVAVVKGRAFVGTAVTVPSSCLEPSGT